VIEESHFADRMSAQNFFKKSDAALVDTFKLIGVQFTTVLNPKSFCHTDLKVLVKELKTFVSGFFPMVLGDELPEGFVIDGLWSKFSTHARSYLQPRFSNKRNLVRKIRLAALLNYSKRLFPNLPRELVDAKLADFTEFITSPDTDVLHEREALENAIDREVNRLPVFKARYDQPFVPTGSSCLESTRANGGIQGWTKKILQSLFDHFPWLEKIHQIEGIGEEILFGSMSPIWNEILSILFSEAIESFPMEGPWDLMEVAPAAIAEPLKVRIVTRSSWILQLLKPIQLAWHSTMRQDSVYELIGGKSVEDALVALKLEKGQKFVSGDYESATDRIHLHYTKYTAQKMFERTRFTFPEGMVFQDMDIEGWLNRMVIHSFDSIFIGESSNVVLRGQMMGHILSFPLLCIINKAASSLTLPPDRWMRINGDDVLFPASKREYKEWELHTKHVGLKKSIGKNYYSRDLAMINSEVYTWSKEKNRMVRLIFPNVGLLGYLGDFVDKFGRQVTPWEQLSGIVVDFWKGIEPRYHDFALRMLRERYPIVSGFPGSFFGPTNLGCLGLPVPAGHTYTRYQRIWMEAHRLGVYSFREGIRTDYARIETLYQKEIPLQDEFLRWGVPDVVLTPENILPDPYSRSGGLSRELMQIRRWFEGLITLKHQKIFGRRRFNRFLIRNPLPPLSGEALDSVLQNQWHESRPQWYHIRQGTLVDEPVVRFHF
jgi:hypothetical protein